MEYQWHLPQHHFVNLFLTHKEADSIKVQCKLGTINKSFQIIDDLLSLTHDSIFVNHYQDIYPTELEFCNFYVNVNNHFLIFTFTLKMQNSILNYLKNKTTFAFDIARMPFYCSNVPSKMCYGSTGTEFLTISRASRKTEDLSRACKQLLS